MTDYETGFSNGERIAWETRGTALPKPPENISGEYARGFWDARLPRDPSWARPRSRPAKWDLVNGRYVVREVA